MQFISKTDTAATQLWQNEITLNTHCNVGYSTRNSAVADKPRDAFVQMQNGEVADLLKHAPHHMCYHAEFGRSALKGVGMNIEYTRTSKIWERWNSAVLGWKALLTPRYTPLPTLYVTTSNLVVL